MKKCIKKVVAMLLVFMLVLGVTLASVQPKEAEAYYTTCMHVPFSYYSDVSNGGLPRYMRVDACALCGFVFGRSYGSIYFSVPTGGGDHTLSYLLTGRP